ncbi:MAG: hypothetical protein BWY42_01219 [Candidatus Omnitrophica bacterium ADurb.Bin277]|nr:MAG: hypothetical protein BWY42_01219 [Candidatus Omnitrophica bacterium ADurb.Bin277]
MEKTFKRIAKVVAGFFDEIARREAARVFRFLNEALK